MGGEEKAEGPGGEGEVGGVGARTTAEEKGGEWAEERGGAA